MIFVLIVTIYSMPKSHGNQNSQNCLSLKNCLNSENRLSQGKKLSKDENFTNFDLKKNKPSFLILKARETFNCLWLAFIKAPILWHFDPECYIKIEIDASSYAISIVLS